MTRRARFTPDCAIRGCGKAARRLGMCAEHAALAPPNAGVTVLVACLLAQRAAKQRQYREAQAYVRRALRDPKRESAANV